MERIAEIGIRKGDKPVFCRLPDDVSVAVGDWCIVEAGQGHLEAGRVVRILDPKDPLRPPTAGKVLRTMTHDDLLTSADNEQRKEEAFRICKEKIAEQSLQLKLIDVEYAFDRSRLVIYYWAEGRVDFRKLVRELAAVFSCRIEMKQIGLRDEARMKGGCGMCGRTLCCATFLHGFESITMRMVKAQKLPLDMNKITGLCGRLMCCISYEDDFYRNAKEREKAGNR